MSTQTQHPADQPATSPARSRRIAVVSSSVRSERFSPIVADWVIAALAEGDGVEVDLIDLATITLPDDSQLYPGGGPKSEVAERIEQAEAFVFVTPEYNHSYPASLKRLIDCHYSEWMLKPATVVAYGVQGGHSAIEHLRGVLAELNMVTTRRVIGLSAPWESLDHDARYAPADGVTRGLTGALAELSWWTDILTEARTNRPFPN